MSSPTASERVVRISGRCPQRHETWAKVSHLGISRNTVFSTREKRKSMRNACSPDDPEQGYRPTCRVFTGITFWRSMAEDRAPHSGHRLEVELGGTLADFSTVLGPFFDRFAEVEPDEDARIRILGRRSEKLAYERNTGVVSLQVLPAGSVTLQSWKLIWSVPKNCFSTSAAAPPSIE